MDPKDYLNKSAGIPLDPSKQKDPDEDGDKVPAEGRAEELNDVTGQNGGQRSDVDQPWKDTRNRHDGIRDQYSDDSDKQKP
ncbi:hypothetical protein D7Y13_03810 [Corallococcus praedator]|uniref:Serine/threonine protein kinase n=1 Tax=Corallococcus praedator TaxID=2316724 RepID=A0ABX9QQB1_9BACT|nr:MULTISPECIES: hypothetical protein [Corallococcus]RKH20867.1 hypothetical protein D7X74_02970 [Corallococcus sp. CA047B]RKH35421.1 hypothetical protein D7X75_04495 [Corallococcus sp. CA031C]RKI15698.1 hypothetical protein D7Y13_03810 [Corallococcus praedator]